MSAARAARRMSAGFIAIILFKYFKGIVFLLAGIAAVHVARLSTLPSVEELARFFRVAPENELIRWLANLIQEVTPGQFIGFGVVSLFVGAVFTSEATFLAFRIWWSTYFTIVLTMLGLPLEIYEIFRKPDRPRYYVLLAINTVILIYLWRRRNEFRFLETEREIEDSVG